LRIGSCVISRAAGRFLFVASLRNQFRHPRDRFATRLLRPVLRAIRRDS